MLEVDIEKIIPITEARDSFNQIIEGVEASDDMYVVTKNGKPSAIIVGVHHLEKLTGSKLPDETFEEKEDEAPSVPLVAADTKTDTKTEEAIEEKPEKIEETASPVSPIATPVSAATDPYTPQSQENPAEDLFDTPKDYIFAPPASSTAPTPPVATPPAATPLAASPIQPIEPTVAPAPAATAAPSEAATSPLDEPLPEETPAPSQAPSTPFPNSFPSTMPAPTQAAAPVTPPTPPTPPTTSI